MALETQVVDIPLGGGLETKIDPKLLPQGRFTRLENAVQNRTGTLDKRYGLVPLPKAEDISAGDLRELNGLAVADDRIYAFAPSDGVAFSSDYSGSSVHLYRPSKQDWRLIQQHSTIDVDVGPSLAGGSLSNGIDGIVLDGLYIYGGLQARDAQSGSFVANAQAASAGGYRVGRAGDLLIFATQDAATSKIKIYSVPRDFSSAATLEETTTETPNADEWDMISVKTQRGWEAHFAVKDSSTLTFFYYDGAGTRNAVDTYSTGFSSANGPLSYVLASDDLAGDVTTLNAVWVRSATEVQGVFVDVAGLSTGNNYSISENGIDRLTGTYAKIGSSDGSALYLSDDVYGVVKYYTVDTAGNATSKDAAYGGNVASRAWHYNGSAYCLLSYGSDEQASFSVAQASGADITILGRIFTGRGGGNTAHPYPQATHLGDGEFTLFQLRRDRLASDGTVSYSVVPITITVDALPQIGSYGRSVLASGGGLYIAGRAFEPNGSWLYYDDIALSTSASGGSMASGTYYFTVVGEYFDSFGQLKRTNPSTPKSIAVTGPNGTVTVTADRLFSGYNSVAAYVYRTEAGASSVGPFYKIDTLTIGANNLSRTDGTADANIIDNEILYTTGGVLGHIEPPAIRCFWPGSDRLFVVPADDPTVIWPSFPKRDAVAFEFSDLTTLSIPQGGSIVAGIEMDGRQIVFKPKAIYAFAGEGPNALGVGSFSAPSEIISGVGCQDRNSVVRIPAGVLFKDVKGFYLLGRDTQVQYIGSPVEAFNGYQVVAATQLVDREVVRFELDGGPTIEYDYYHQTWQTHYYPGVSVGAGVYQGRYTRGRRGGVVEIESDGYLDGGQSYGMALRTGWIHLAGLQGFQRIRRFALLGDYHDDHRVRVRVYYDYNDEEVVQTIDFDAAQNQRKGEPLQFRARLSRQKCQAIMFEIEELVPDDTERSLSLTALSLELGIKRGINRLPARKTL